MKINEKLINDIINLKVRIKKEEDKIELSLYEDFIPMYDIYTHRIYSVPKEDLYYRLTESSYRFIDNTVYSNLKEYYDICYKKIKKSDNKKEKEHLVILFNRLYKILVIINNYKIDLLINTSYKSLFENSKIDTLIDTTYKNTYENSEELGLSISVCTKNSFNPFILYLKPYYSKLELIKLGQNMNIIDKNTKVQILIKEKIHFDICKLIYYNDVAFDEIKNHSLTIKKNNSITDITFYSFIGASLLNNFLRRNLIKGVKDISLNKFYYDRLKNIVKTMKKIKPLKKDYYIYRFISDDKFLKNIKIGETFRDQGFLSTTRDPFYSPGLNGTFGLILVKIYLNKNVKGHGLFVEHFSLFPKEEEYILAPFTKLKLVAKNNKFKYYHTNKEFEEKIYKKYELEFVGLDYSWFDKIKVKEVSCLHLEYEDINAKNKMDIYNHVISMANKYNQIKINNMIFNCYFFDSTGAYSKFYYNKIEKGLVLIHFDENGYPLLVIEMGQELAINYMNQYYYYNEKKELKEDIIIDIVLKIGEIFHYKSALIFNTYENFTCFKSNFSENNEIFLYMNHFDRTLYNYLKYNKKPFKSEKNYKNNLKKIDSLINKSIPKEMIDEFHINFEGKSLKELLLFTIEKNFIYYLNISKYLKLNEINYGVFIMHGSKELPLKLDNSDRLYREPFDRIC